ncbi:MerR family transcriptional regulator [Bradyrhizobium rifense]|uniref:MerR family transcriptional regulator n=1 Tax=Bradyrhizobium rifense TaxID=515499 RepID=A0A5D3KKQ1_9BRAD|nr:MerR family transcriptional regulator [Bradyrhizobium rifense]TYL96633.1 MerR family transcriptional regulator [Bradyrhizobium rifense]
MTGNSYTIGEISELSGVSVRRIRFYSDKGLLPPMGRSSNGYRVYSEGDLARLDLIRALRDTGVGLKTIRKILSHALTLTEVLQMRLGTLEAEIASRRRIAAVVRATLRASEPAASDLRKLWAITTLSQAQLRKMIESFIDKVVDGFQVDDAWKTQMIEASTPELPEEPTPEQIDACNEIIKMLTEESFTETMRSEMALVWKGEFDLAAYTAVSEETLAKARQAIANGDLPTSTNAVAIAREWLTGLARVMRRDADGDFIDWARTHRKRARRYQELVLTLRGHDSARAAAGEWLWSHEAMTPLLESAA